jgi:hypothetical protein
MKTNYLIIIVLIISNFSCTKKCILNYEIVETKYEIPIYHSVNQTIKEIDKVKYNRYELVNVNEYEVPYIMEVINSQIPKNRRATKNIIENICDYSVQIAGIYDRKEKVKKIYLNFHCGYVDFESINSSEEVLIGFDGKETKFQHSMDGGDCFFEAIINTKTNKLAIIMINGEA